MRRLAAAVLVAAVALAGCGAAKPSRPDPNSPPMRSAAAQAAGDPVNYPIGTCRWNPYPRDECGENLAFQYNGRALILIPQ